jgi:hypothetical protein
LRPSDVSAKTAEEEATRRRRSSGATPAIVERL